MSICDICKINEATYIGRKRMCGSCERKMRKIKEAYKTIRRGYR